ncbi:YqeG family HAD IIIA-type phosphatase [Lutispora sp.]|uniref:YqeG family HAD IIIA-type phosphatase n=1 Tax=Lutispora sp. TaxID=2828727 RepID=UPI002B2169F6|nr:YqeG family HAD IIIA-type phosphatase [Lutispora sp.]MEA4961679.1 YqeG family HAD IIIA-type phosphatase [Lutispora sp.]
MKKLLIPDMHYESVFSIDIEILKQNGIEGIIIDIDNTLVAWDTKEADEKALNFIKSLQGENFKICMISNNTKKRVEKFNEILALPAIHKAGKPKISPFLKAMKLLQTNQKNTAVIGDQMFTDILGGNRIGLFTILVTPISPKEFIWTRFMRKIERFVLKKIVKERM